MQKQYLFETDCVSASARHINDMRFHSKERTVTYATMRRHCEGLSQWAKDHGYGRDCGLSLPSDWAVSYHKSVYRKQPCYYLCWSSIEYVWVRRS